MHLFRALLLLGQAVASATTYPVGPARTYLSPCALVAAVTLGPGDVVEVDPGTYNDACQLTASGSAADPIVLRGLPGPRPVFDATGVNLSGSGSVPRAIFQFTGGSYWLVQHLELTNASNASLNGAAFRATAGSHDIVIEDVSVHDCQDGFMSDGVATVTVRFSDIFHTGAGDGYSHNLYMQGQSTVLIGNHIHDSVGGQNVKIRSHDALLAYNLIENAGNYGIDLIQGPLTSQASANAALIGNVIVRPTSADNNSQVILWGTDNATEDARNGSLYAVHTFVMRTQQPAVPRHQPVAGSQIVIENNLIAATVDGTWPLISPPRIIIGGANWIQSGVVTVPGLSPRSAGPIRFVGGGDYHPPPARGRPTSGPDLLDGSGATERRSNQELPRGGSPGRAMASSTSAPTNVRAQRPPTPAWTAVRHPMPAFRTPGQAAARVAPVADRAARESRSAARRRSPEAARSTPLPLRGPSCSGRSWSLRPAPGGAAAEWPLGGPRLLRVEAPEGPDPQPDEDQQHQPLGDGKGRLLPLRC
jgi:hypothetical protein